MALLISREEFIAKRFALSDEDDINLSDRDKVSVPTIENLVSDFSRTHGIQVFCF